MSITTVDEGYGGGTMTRPSAQTRGDGDEGREPLYTYRFDGAQSMPVDEMYNELQRAIMPVVGVADGVVEPFATCFCISSTMSLIVTAWHVVEEFMAGHRSELEAGASHLAVVYESDEPHQNGHGAIGGPLPVYSVSHQPGLDLALLHLWDVDSSSGPVRPGSVAPVGFAPPPSGDYCYGFGYPHLAGGGIYEDKGRRAVDFVRVLHRTGGRVVDVFAEGNAAHLKLPGPHLDCDLPMPSGFSGGPVHTDKGGICGVMSTSYDPFDPGDRWASYVSLLAPLLAFPIRAQDAHGRMVEATVHDLAVDGHITFHGELPPRPPTVSTRETIFFGPPA